MRPIGSAPAPPPVNGSDEVVVDVGGTVEPSGASVLEDELVGLLVDVDDDEVEAKIVDGEISMLVVDVLVVD